MTSRPVSRRGLVMLAAASVGWGCSTTLSAFALRQIGPTDLLAVELVSGGIVIWTVALMSASREFATPDWRAFAVLGLCEPGLTYLLANEGLRRDSAATAALLFALEAVVVVPLAAVFLGERVSSGVLLALGVGLVGALITAGGAREGRDTLAGHLLILGSTLAAASYALLARRSSHRAPALVVTTYQLLAATAIALPFAIVSHMVGRAGPPQADLSHWLAGIVAGLAGVALPFLLYNRAIVEVPATIAAGVLNLVPLVGFATAVLFLGDRPTRLEIVGGCLILLSAAWLGHSETRASLPPQASASG
ncbi:MAG TPA: DMT family transporter [Solirubrobacteraceae bacterium]|jgi:drug/metabolite transporter (DMT)-like permease|nr:DMT family transporter [Solirubrobacteraceae bacterium]